jgi:hypothetical protein
MNTTASQLFEENPTYQLVDELLKRIEFSNGLEFVSFKCIVERRGKLNQHIANIPTTKP